MMPDRLTETGTCRSTARGFHKRALWLSSGAALLALALMGSLEAARPSAGSLLNERLGCAACHGMDGIALSEEIPNLAGQDRSYLIRQLEAFVSSDPEAELKAGGTERYHSAMDAATRKLSYREREDLADFYAGLSCVPRGDLDPGSAPKAAQACAQCHGAFGINIEPGVPNLAGQKVDYLIAQLRAFRASLLGTDPFRVEQERFHQKMASQAHSLTDEDIERIAAYYAELSCS